MATSSTTTCTPSSSGPINSEPAGAEDIKDWAARMAAAAPPLREEQVMQINGLLTSSTHRRAQGKESLTLAA